MKAFSFFMGLVLATIVGRAADASPVQTLIGREFVIHDDFAGQELAFRRYGESIAAVWRILGSGVPIISEGEYRVEIKGPRQLVFEVELRDKSRSRIKVELGDSGDVRIYLNGVRIRADEKTPNQSLQPTAPSRRG